MNIYRIIPFLIASALYTPIHSSAQQFIGLNTTDYSAIQHMATNPAWVNNSENGVEAMLFSVNALAGTNAYTLDKRFIFSGFKGKAIEDEDYYRDPQTHNKYLWGNIEINGPAISFKHKDNHHFGIFTRGRQIYRAGNVSSTNFRMLGTETPELFVDQPVIFKKAGFTTHTFTELGLTYGRILHNDYYSILKGGFSLKYLMGFVAGSVYSDELTYIPGEDSITGIKGDLNVNYTHNIDPYTKGNAQNYLSEWLNRAGRWGLGLDLGMQYEYHPNGNPNEPTPYLFSIAASITDIGGIGYVADTGSGTYNINVAHIDTNRIIKPEYEGVGEYFVRLDKDSLLGNGEMSEKFRVGLPTAFRLNADINAGDNLNFAVNLLLNMRGNSKTIYRPAYVSYINFTPTYGSKNFKVSIPFTVIGYQSFTVGTTIRVGPFYVGSTSIASSFISNNISNIDAYIGLVWKFHVNEFHYF